MGPARQSHRISPVAQSQLSHGVILAAPTGRSPDLFAGQFEAFQAANQDAGRPRAYIGRLGAHTVVERIRISYGLDAEKVNRISDGHVVATYLIACTGIVFQPTTFAM